ncbi:MAG: TIR domain-containing protein [Planctomycetes bacterium]|nr:TIR domain-containing protein [Planctomycetota bacterium]MCW8134431.1 TIR domain-containing protein [Planctomycetota bacterium]
MADLRNIFISHAHEDDAELPGLKKLIASKGMEVRDSSITSDKPNAALNKEYIQREILLPRIQWASTLVVLISHDTAGSWWVNWEIQKAVELGKKVVGVFAQGATDADVPEELKKCGDAVVVGWQGERVIDAINGDLKAWDDPATGKPRPPGWDIQRIVCQ